MRLTYKQKEELALKYLKEKGISFGNSMADEKALEIYIAGLEAREDSYEHIIDEFKESHKWMLKSAWEEMYKYLSKK